MGVNYGQPRPRMQDMTRLDPVTLASIGETDMDFWIFDYTQVAERINEELDRVQAEYNIRFNFPPAKPWVNNNNQ